MSIRALRLYDHSFERDTRDEAAESRVSPTTLVSPYVGLFICLSVCLSVVDETKRQHL